MRLRQAFRGDGAVFNGPGGYFLSSKSSRVSGRFLALSASSGASGTVEVVGEPSQEAVDQLAGEVGGEYYESEGTRTVSSMDLFDANNDDAAPSYSAT